MFLTRNCWFFIIPAGPTDYVSSTLVKLKINVATFLDCLILLDGRLESLSTLIINVTSIRHPIIDVDRAVSTTACIATYRFNIRLYYFTEETAKAEMLFIHLVQFHISL